MRVFLFRFVGTLTTLLIASGAWGATVIYDGATATGINGLVVNSQTYSVAFVRDSFNNLDGGSNFPLFGDSASTQAAANAINLILNSEPTVPGEVGPSAGNARGIYGLPFAVTSESGVQTFGGSYTLFTPDVWSTVGASKFPDNTTDIYAILTPVPVPAAVWLFGSALGLLGWMRRKAPPH